MKSKDKILILGISGMLGNALFRFFSADENYITYGALRSSSQQSYFLPSTHRRIFTNINVENVDALLDVFEKTSPDIVINAVGVIKQLAESECPLVSLPINSVLPHRLAKICSVSGARLIHMSTDCVFSGKQGNYKESDFPDATDLYGRTKLLGEVDYPNAITIRTSIIGTELNSAKSLLGWFLAQEESVKGYRNAIFSGLPTVEIARVIRDYVLPHPELRGVYHLSADPTSKYDLLHYIADAYNKSTEIIPDDEYVIDRSLNSDRFRIAVGFMPKSWSEMVKSMYEFELNNKQDH